MDALEFAREHDRMCKMYKEPSPDGACDNCPITGKCKCDDWTQAVPIVEKWSKEHPIVRNVDHVAEMLEKAYQQGRADAFHEVIAEMCKSPFAGEKVSIAKKYIQEQLKEKENE